MKQTGDIKRCVVLEESSISKGIRRIVAVTGEEAFEVQRVADDFDKRLTQLKSMEGVSLEAGLKATGKDLDEATLPLLRKHKLRQEFASIKKAFDDADKARKAKEMKEAAERVKSFFEQNPEAPFLVEVLPYGGNAKVCL